MEDDVKYLLSLGFKFKNVYYKDNIRIRYFDDLSSWKMYVIDNHGTNLGSAWLALGQLSDYFQVHLKDIRLNIIVKTGEMIDAVEIIDKSGVL